MYKLPSPIEFNDYISPVCLTNSDINIAIGQKATVTGWGLDDKEFKDQMEEVQSDTVQKLLTQTDVIFRPKTDCAYYLNERQVCAGITTPVARDSCEVKQKCIPINLEIGNIFIIILFKYKG